MMKQQTTLLRLLALSLVFQFSLKAQKRHNLGRYTMIEKLERRTYNFFETNKKSQEEQRKDKGVYVVYSDRTNNRAYKDAMGLEEIERQEFLTPYYVVGDNGNYLQLVKKDNSEVDKPEGIFSFFYTGKYNFKDIKEIDYVGWVHKNNLMRYSHAKISANNFHPVNFVLGYNNVNELLDIKKLAKKDSVKTYKDPKLRHRLENKSFFVNQMVYLYKYNENKTSALISNYSHMEMGKDEDRIMGWVSTSLLTAVGQRRVIKLRPNYVIPIYDNGYQYRGSKSTPNQFITQKSLAAPFIYDNSILDKKIDEDSAVEVTVPIKIWDHSNNKLINVIGGNITLDQIEAIKQQQQRININLVFDCNRELRPQLLKQIASLQRIWSEIQNNELYKNYDFSFSASSYGCNQFYSLAKTSSFIDWIDYLQSVFASAPIINPTKTKEKGIGKAFNFILKESGQSVSFENNIVLILGDKQLGITKQEDEFSKGFKTQLQKLASISSKMLFIQIENKENKAYQEFIFGAKQILDEVGKNNNKFLTNFVVESKFIVPENMFISYPSKAKDNIYIYDTPDESMYNGGLIFPQVGNKIARSSFDSSFDLVLSNSISYNKAMYESLEKSAKEVQFLRSKPYKRISDLMAQSCDSHGSIQIPKNAMNERFLDKGYIKIKQDFILVDNYYLFSQEELESLIAQYRSLIPAKGVTVSKKFRKYLSKVYRKNTNAINAKLHYDRLSEDGSIGDLLYYKTGLPIKDEKLNQLKIGDIKSDSKFTYVQFIEKMAHLRNKIDDLENLMDDNEIETYTDGGGKTYIYVPEELLF